MDKFIEMVLQKISEQGISVVFLAFALYYMHIKLSKLEHKISECEADRLKLWERIAQLHD